MRALLAVILSSLAATLLAPAEGFAQRRARARRHAAPMPAPLPLAQGYARAQIDRCARADAVACREAGVHLARGIGGARRDPAAAAVLLERAWSLDRNEGCEWFFHLRDELSPAAVQRACDRGCSFACETRAWQRLAQDPAEGVASLERLCDRGSAHACFTLGHALLDGRLVPRDRRGALEHIARACDLGGPFACYEMNVEQWGAELERARAQEVDPARLAATAPLRAPPPRATAPLRRAPQRLVRARR